MTFCGVCNLKVDRSNINDIDDVAKIVNVGLEIPIESSDNIVIESHYQ